MSDRSGEGRCVGIAATSYASHVTRRWWAVGWVVALFLAYYFFIAWPLCNDCPASDLFYPWKILFGL